MIRVVIDANVLASASVGHPESPSRRVLDAALAGTIEMVACEMLLGEVEQALETRYFSSRLTPEQRAAVGVLLRTTAVMLPDPVAPPRRVRDEDDDYVAALAVAAQADVIVTGDRDLLEQADLQPSAITPREACKRFRLT